jgi:hypothetical protein
MTPAQPEAITVTRYRCPFCHRSRAKKQATAAHIQRCWHNPANRTCKTCPFYSSDRDGEYCDNDAAPEGDEFPVVACPAWQPAEGVEPAEPTSVPCRDCGTPLEQPQRHGAWRGQWLCGPCTEPKPVIVNGSEMPF